MTSDEAESAGLWETMRTARAIRRFEDRPVDDALIAKCLEAATWAPSGGNQQPWRFVLLQSDEARQILEVGANRALATIQRVYQMERPDEDDDSPYARNARAMFGLHDGARDVPAAVLFCVRQQPSVPRLLEGGSIYPGMQNFLLAARACGLGACVTGWHGDVEEELRGYVGIPENWMLAALVVVGWPKGHHGPVRRKPVSEVATVDRWEAGFPG